MKKQEGTHLSTYSIHLRAMQPTTTSWVNKQSTIAMTKQTSPSSQVHLLTQTRMKIYRKTGKTWEETTQILQENTGATQEKRNTTKTPWVLHCKNSYTEKLKQR